MPVFHVTSPDGRTIEVTAPDGATEQQAIEYAQAHLASMTAAAPKPPEESLLHKAASAYSNAVAGPVEGAAHIASGAVAAPVAGIAGLGAAGLHALGANVDPADVVTGVQNAMTYQPRTAGGQATTGAIDTVGSAIPKVADKAGQATAEATGSPLLGTLVNTGLQGAGMWATGKIPAVAASAPVMRATHYVSDLLPGGAARASDRLINMYANDTPGGRGVAQQNVQAHVDAEKSLAQAGQSGALATKYGISPTGTQVSGSPGLAQLDRTIRNQGEGVAAPLNAADTANRGAVVDILKGISGTPEQRLRAATARDFAARTAYDDALNNPDHFVQPPGPSNPSFAAEAAAKQGLTQDGTPPINNPNESAVGLNPVGERLQEVLQRPAMQTAMQDAKMQAANRGVKLDDRNLMQQLHYAKLSIDGQISAASRTGDSTTMGGLLDTKNTLLGVMDDLSPAYKQAREGFRDASRPLNRMDVGEALRQKYLSALQDASGTGSRPTMLLEALRREDGDTLAQQATGFNGATLEGTLNPADLNALDAARAQLGREAFAQNAGRGVGSNTGQNLASQTAIDSIGNASSAAGHLGELGLAIHNPLVSIPLGMRGSAVKMAAKQKIANTLASPEDLAASLKKQYTGRVPDAVAIPGAVGANDDGQVKNFWDLTQQARSAAP